MRRAISTLAATALLMACGDSQRGDAVDTGISSDGISTSNDGTSGDDNDTNTTTGNDGPLLDLGNDDGATTGMEEGGDPDCAGNPPNTDALLEGIVYAPNMKLPISGALVYVTDEMLLRWRGFLWQLSLR
ncbi:MAG: hypothetical protein R6X02_18725 [Enhygromyxa sp.]